MTTANQPGCTDVPGLSVTWTKTSVLSSVFCLSSKLVACKRSTCKYMAAVSFVNRQSFVFAVILCDIKRKTRKKSAFRQE